MFTPAEVIALAVGASVVTSGWHHFLHVQETKRRAEAQCRDHRWVYHCLGNDVRTGRGEGRYWNRVCTFCGKHETRWDDTQHPNWPPAGARIRRESSIPDEAWRERVAELKSLVGGR